MQEIILKKLSVIKTSVNIELLNIINQYVKEHGDKFKNRKWNCNSSTSHSLCHNILHDVIEFKNVREAIHEQLTIYFEAVHKRSIPFLINESWINIIDKWGYQEFHEHSPAFASGVLYISEQNSDIEFATFPSNSKTLITPKKGDLLFFEGNVFHRVIDSDKKRISLAFNIYAP